MRAVPRQAGLARADRWISGALALAFALLLGGCGQQAARPHSGAAAAAATGAGTAAEPGALTDAQKVLNVYNWSDYIDPQVLKDFEKQYGIKVNYDVFDKNEALETKLLTGNTGFDVVVPSAPFLELEIRAGALEKLDKSELPNRKYLDPAVERSVAQYDPGN